MADQRDPYDFGPHPAQPPAYGPGAFGASPADQAFAMPRPGDAAPADQGYALDDPFAVVRTPVVWLAGAIALGLAGAVLAAVLGASIDLAFVAWFVAGPVAIGLLAVHSLRDTALRTRLGYDRRAVATVLYVTAVVAAGIGILVSAWRIAEWAGRL